MNYFELFGIPVSLKVDPAWLRRRYYELSRQYHPDMHTLAGEADQADMLEKSALVNQAFKVLGNEHELLQYVLELKGLLADSDRYALPQLFLMEMMDINEKLMELEYDPDEEAIAALHLDVTAMEQELYSEVAGIMAGFNEGEVPAEGLEKLKEYYYKRKYLLRIKEKLSTFASRN
jgi:molecular chaperone HscB